MSDPNDVAELLERAVRAVPSTVSPRVRRRTKPEPKTGTVYFVHAVGTNLVKIGFTARCTADRIDEMKTGCPFPLERILSLMCAEPAMERRIHERFAGLRAEGEWFRLEGELRDFLERILKSDPTLDISFLFGSKRRVLLGPGPIEADLAAADAGESS